MFERKNPNPMSTVNRAIILQSEYYSFWVKKSRASRSQSPHMSFSKDWRLPPKGMLKLNVDASFNQHNSITYAGIIIRDEGGNVLIGLTKSFFTSSPF